MKIDPKRAATALVRHMPATLTEILGPRSERKGIGACVLATYIGEAALEILGVKTERYPCELSIMNAPYVRMTIQKREPEGRPIVMRIGEGSPDHEDYYRGHLTLIVPDAQTMCDLDLGQFNRPPFDGMPIPEAGAFDWDGQTEPAIINGQHVGVHLYVLKDGSALMYNAHPNPLLYLKDDISPEEQKLLVRDPIRQLARRIARESKV